MTRFTIRGPVSTIGRRPGVSATGALITRAVSYDLRADPAGGTVPVNLDGEFTGPLTVKDANTSAAILHTVSAGIVSFDDSPPGPDVRIIP